MVVTRLTKQEKKALKKERLLEKYKERKRTKRSKKPSRPPREQDAPSCTIAVDVIGGLMTDKELRSLATQVRYCYSENRRSRTPVNLVVTNTREISSNLTADVKNWTATLIEEPLIEVLREGKAGWKIEDIVYLSGDAAEVLAEVLEDKVYVIGGLVDRNRNKNYTLNYCSSLGIKACRLPIDRHFKLSTSAILSVNQVFSILLKYKECREWREALREGIPERKIAREVGEEKEAEGAE